MATISVQIEASESKAAGFRARAGNHESEGRTMGEALDALMIECNDMAQTADIRVEPLLEGEEYVEPYLLNKGGLWVIAGGPKMSSEDESRDFVDEMREERIRSFFPAALNHTDQNENPS